VNQQEQSPFVDIWHWKKSSGLFNSALLESSFCTFWEKERGLNQGSYFIGNLSCEGSDVLSCLRSKSSNEIYQALPSAAWFPVIDDWELIQQPIDSLISGNFNKDITVLFGTNLNEDSLFLCPIFQNINSTQYEEYILQYFGKSIGQIVLELYPVTNYPTPGQAAVDAFTDFIWICPTRKAVDSISSFNVTTYMYSFQALPGYSAGRCYGVAHSYELPFVWPDLANYMHYQLRPIELQLSYFMRQSWANFARNQDPNQNDQFYWPQYYPDGPYIILNYSIQMGNQLRQKYCSFWNSL